MNDVKPDESEMPNRRDGSYFFSRDGYTGVTMEIHEDGSRIFDGFYYDVSEGTRFYRNVTLHDGTMWTYDRFTLTATLSDNDAEIICEALLKALHPNAILEYGE